MEEFDAVALHRALDAQRLERGLTWAGVTRAVWELSADLNATRTDHPIAASTITGMPTRGNTSCQHAVFFLRWLERSPEDFLTGPVAWRAPLPVAGPDRRLRWSLKLLHAALDAGRREQGLTWGKLAVELRCTANQLTGLRTARYATGMRLAMRSTQWLQRPAADFVYLASW